MIGIIQDWLFSQLGVCFDLDKLEENNVFQDGCVLANILRGYGLLSSEYCTNITRGGETEVCRMNLKVLKPIFDLLNVTFNEKVISGVIENNKHSILKLLYEMFVCLENKQHLYFVTQQNLEKVQKNYVECLNKDKIVINRVESKIPEKDSNTCFKQPLFDKRDLIEWYKEKYKQVEENVNSRISKLKRKSIPKNYEKSYNLQKETCPCSCKSDSVDQEFIASLPDLNMFHRDNNYDKLLNYDQFIATFKAKQHQNEVKQCFENNIQNDLLQLTWKKIMDAENKQYNSLFSEIMLKQSQYEKQILTKLIQAQNQIKIESENQIQIKKKVMEEEEKQIYSDISLKEKFEELENIYKNEQKRALELHKKLYKEKQELVKKRHYEICFEVMESLIDLAVGVSEYQSMYGLPVSSVLWNSWKQYFYQSQPIHIPFKTLHNTKLIDEESDYDEIIRFEKTESSILKENDIDEYLYTCGRWFHESICKEYGDINEKTLAFIVYRLLSFKYPPPPSPIPAQLPTFRVAGILLDLFSAESVEKLQMLLSKAGIHIFDTEFIIKKCIKEFEIEKSPAKSENMKSKANKSKTSKKDSKRSRGSSVSYKKNKDEKSEKNLGKKKSKTKKDKGKVKPDSQEYINDGGLNLIHKETQTSIIKEESDTAVKERSPLGMMGEKFLNILKDGQQIEDDLLVSAIIEYLKTLQEYYGWVLLNYPATLHQASVFELALSGKYLPVEEYLLEEIETNERAQEGITDQNAEKRKSKILECPILDTTNSQFKTYFTIFLKMKLKNLLTQESKVKNAEEKALQETEDHSETSSNQAVLPDVLESFYGDQAIFENFYFENYDLLTLKKLARTILKENAIEQKNSLELFGEEILNKLSKSKKKDQKGKSSISGKSKKMENSKKGQKSLRKDGGTTAENFYLNKENFIDETKVASESEQTQSSPDAEKLEPKATNPDDEEWVFTSLPLNEEVAVILATIWENIEKCYLQNLEDICFENRMINLRLVPYSMYVKDMVEQVANEEDVRQDIVNLFQKYYMDIDKNLRELPEVKNYLFCKVLEMQQNLWQIIDDKRNKVESKRQEVINENWLVNELRMLINNYLSLIQTEFDRSVETLKLIRDYYLTMLEKFSNIIIPTQLANSKVNKVTSEDLLLIGIHDSSQQSESDTSLTENIGSGKYSTVAKNLTDCYEKGKIIKCINFLVPTEIEHISKQLHSISNIFLAEVKSETDSLELYKKKVAKEKSVATKTIKSVDKKNETVKKKKVSKVKEHNEENNSFHKKNASLKSSIAEDNIDLNITKKESLVKEWKFVVETELDRFNLRMDLITARAQEDITEFYCYLEAVFCDLLSSNLSKYNNDINSVDNLCEYFRTAIEEESPLIYPIVLKRSNFYIDTRQDLSNKQKSEDVTELLEQIHSCYFTINQLKKLMYVFKIAGPHGVIRKQPFHYILQDLMISSKDNQPNLPEDWNRLSEYQLIKLIDKMFGLEYAINWRDFIVYNLYIPYPTVDEILNLRKQFMLYDLELSEVVSLQTYEDITLWFEQDLPNDPQEGLRFVLIKELLGELFKVGENKINYTALLLQFCKDVDPVIGLRKALCLAVGKNVITTKDELEEMLKEEEEIKASVINLLENIVSSIVQNREGVLIYEVFESMSDFTPNFGDDNSEYTVSTSSGSKTISFDNDQITVEPDGTENVVFDNQNGSCSTYSKHSMNISRQWVSKIPISAVVSILNASFLHQDKTFSLRNQYLYCLEEESDKEGMIEAHVLVTSDCVKKLFTLTNKFKITLPCEILKECLKDS